MISTFGLFGMFIVVAFCRIPGVGYWKGFSIRNRNSRLTPIGGRLYLACACGLILGTLADVALHGRDSHTKASQAEKLPESEISQAEFASTKFEEREKFDGKHIFWHAEIVDTEKSSLVVEPEQSWAAYAERL